MCLPRISTHALTEGDPFPRLLLCRKRNFNSRPHGGRRYVYRSDIYRIVFQLTPSRRATFWRSACSEHLTHFNSRPHGGRRWPQVHSPSYSAFQLTPSRRATLQSERKWRRLPYFNSRPHGGRHLSGTGKDLCISISTHALTEGDTF